MIPKHQHSGETHSHIMAASKRCFAENGYDATGIAEICQSAGVSKGAFYHHFSSKQEVFLALLYRWLEDTDQQLTMFKETDSYVPNTIRSMAVVPQYMFGAVDHHLPIYFEFLT